jgi:hypothetical protein
MKTLLGKHAEEQAEAYLATVKPQLRTIRHQAFFSGLMMGLAIAIILHMIATAIKHHP